jgi:GNAT superfamily N-acetyltransferase
LSAAFLLYFSMKITAAESPEQFEAIRILFREYARAMDYDTCFDTLEQELAALPGPFAPPEGALLLAEIDSRPAGCVGLVKIESGPESPDTCCALAAGEGPVPVCEMVRLWVRPEFRGRQVGLGLIRAILDEAGKLGYGRVQLETLPDRMEKAVALYRSLGFKEIEGVRSSKCSDRVLLMAMEL